MDAAEIAHSITIEAIRAGVNRPDEITALFQTVMEQAKGSTAPATIGIAEEDIGRPEPEIADEVVRSEPVVEPEPEAVVERAPLPSKAWRETPKAKTEEQEEEPVSAQLSAGDIAASYGDEFIKCLECGQTKQQIKGHLNKMHGMSVDDYKAKWGLPDDYPTIAPATRRRFQVRAANAYAKAKEEGRGLAAYGGPRSRKQAVG